MPWQSGVEGAGFRPPSLVRMSSVFIHIRKLDSEHNAFSCTSCSVENCPVSQKRDTGLCQILTDLLACSNAWSDLVIYVAVSRYQFWKDSSVGDLFRTVCCPKQSVHQSLPPLRKCNARHRGHLYRKFQICGRRIALVSIQLNKNQRLDLVEVQYMNDLMQRLIYVCMGWSDTERSWRCHSPTAHASCIRATRHFE